MTDKTVNYMIKKKLSIEQRQILWLIISGLIGLSLTIVTLLSIVKVIPEYYQWLLIPVIFIFIFTVFTSKKIREVKDSDIINSLVKNNVVKKNACIYIFNASGSLLKKGTYALNLVERRLQVINYEDGQFQKKYINYTDIKKCYVEGNKKYTLFFIQLVSNKKYQFEKPISVYKIKNDHEFRAFFKRLMEVTGQI